MVDREGVNKILSDRWLGTKQESEKPSVRLQPGSCSPSTFPCSHRITPSLLGFSPRGLTTSLHRTAAEEILLVKVLMWEKSRVDLEIDVRLERQSLPGGD